MNRATVGTTLRRGWGALLERFMPAESVLRDADEVRRARLLVAVALFVCGWSAFNSLFQLAMGRTVSAGIAAVVVVGSALAPVTLRASGRVGVATSVLVGGLFLAASVPNLVTGGAVPGPMFLLAMLAAVATMLAGRRSGLVWAGLGVAEILVVQLLPQVASSEILSGPLTAGRTRLAQPLLAMVLFMVLALIAEHLKQRTLEELANATESARRARDARTQFIANVTHELRTPLAGIIGLSDVLLQEGLSDDHRRHVATIRRSADALLHDIGSVLDFSKLDVGRLTINAEPFSPRQTADDVVRLLSPAAARGGITLRLDAHEPLPAGLVGDALRVRQVLVNLVGNAIKFTRAGEVVVSLASEPLATGDERLTLAVRDTGPGISAEDLERIFEPFEQVDSSSRRRHGGTGLGLPISRRIVALMGGELTVQTAMGEGTTFRFTLDLPRHSGPLRFKASGGFELASVGGEGPPSSVSEAAPSKASSSTLGPSAGAHRGGEGVLLVAEDLEINQFIVSHMLDQLGVAFELVEDGEQAVVAAQRPGVAAVLMDLQMPVLDGIGATQQIRAGSGEAARVPVVALTASDLPEIREQCAAVGIHHILQKPLDRAVLVAVLEDIAPQLLPMQAVGASAPPQAPT